MSAAAAPKKTKTPMIIAIVVAAVLGVPCVIGVLAAVAIPAFIGYLNRAKTAEAEANLRMLHSSAAAYYAQEHFGPDGTVRTHCTVGSAITPNTPSNAKTVLDALPESFEALGVSLADPVYYQYEIVSEGGCDRPPNTPLYTFRAHGDLDGDGQRSLFELSAGSDANGALERAPGIYRENELE